jgi:tRNA dimethylallyltransferase
MAIQWPREIRRERIKVRLQERLDAGMIEEVKSLHEQGVSWDKLSFFGLEYRLIAQYLQNELNYNDMFQKLHSAIARFAKKQDTWLRKMAREGLTLHPIEGGPEMLSQAEKILQAEGFSKS